MNINNSKYLVLSIFLLILFSLSSQITINNANTATQLVNNIFLGTGITATNITIKGVNTTNKYQYGDFSTSGSTSTKLGFTNGIILTSGNTKDIPNNPCSSMGSGGYFSSTSGEYRDDSDAKILSSGQKALNICVLEFDFIPSSDSIKFKYTFGSAEYPTYNCQSFNDVFGFLLSGPGISGGKGFTNDAVNLALLPGTNTYVTINNVNDGTSAGTQCTLTSAQRLANFNGTVPNVGYCGFTIPLYARAKVTPCQTYHIRLIIADVTDGAMDSGVFLEAGSFSSPGVTAASQITDASGAPLTNNYITENCSKAVLTFTASPIPTSNYTINYTLGGTATNSSDYTIPASVTIPAGQASTQLTISPTTDNLVEGDETITIQLLGQATCSGTTPVQTPITITIKDELKISATKTSDPTCSLAFTVNSDGVITLTPTGGASPYTFSLDNGNTYPFTSSPISTLGNGTYNIKVKDKDGCVASDLTSIQLNTTCSCTAPSITSIKTNPSTCGGSDGKITLSGLTNGKTYTLSYVKDGATTPITSSFTASGTSYAISGLAKGAYSKINLTESGCTSNDESQTLADPNAIAITSTKTNPSTCGGSDGKITISGLTNGSTYTLSYIKDGSATPITSSFTASGTSYAITGLVKGAYTKINLTESGCTSNDESQTLADPNAIAITSTKTNPSTCSGSDGEITLSGLTDGKTYTLSYVKDGAATPITSSFTASGTTYDISGLAKGAYTKINLTEAGCTSNDEAQSLVEPNAISITSTKTDPSICSGTDGEITISGLTNGSTYALSFVKDGSSPTTSSFTTTGTVYDITSLGKGVYTKINVTEAGCTSNDETQSLVDPNAISITSTKSDPSICGGINGKITISGLTNGSTYALSFVKDGATPTTSSFTTTGTAYDITSLGKGVYTKINVTEAGCTSNDETQTLTNPAGPAKPTASLTQPTCEINTGTITITSPLGNFTYSTDGVNFQVSPIFNALTANNSYKVLVKDLGGCKDSSDFKIDTILSTPTNVNYLVKNATCISTTGFINVTSPIGSYYLYSINGTSFQSTTTFNNLNPGTYTLTTKNLSGCSRTNSITIKNAPAPPNQPFAIVKQPDCDTKTGTITVVNPSGTNYSYSLDNITFQKSPIFASKSAGNYTYFVKDTTQCFSSNTINVQAPPTLPTASFNYTPTDLTLLNTQAIFTNNSLNSISYKWNFDDGSKFSIDKNPIHEFPGIANVYFVKLTAFNNLCSDDTTIAITVIEKPIIYIPNSFTPNTDEINNSFLPVIAGGISSDYYSLYIFNRWGNLLFESHNKDIGWDGTYGNKICLPDTYIWKIEYKESTGNKLKKQLVGHVNLIN